MKKLLSAALAALLGLTAVSQAFAQVTTYTDLAPDGSRITVPVSPTKPLPTTASVVGGGTTVKATAAAPTFVEGSTTNQLSADLSGGLRISGSVAAAVKATAADPTYVEGSTTNPPSVDLTGYARSLAKQMGTWNITNISGTISLPTGASTAANQTATQGSKAAGTAASAADLVAAVFNTSLPTLTNGQQAALQSDSSGRLIINCGTGCNGGLAQGSTTSGQTGVLDMGAVTTAAPSYTTAQTSPFSLTTTGDLRVFSALGATAAKQDTLLTSTGTPSTTPCASSVTACDIDARLAHIEAIGESTAASSVKVDQTTDGTTNAVAPHPTTGMGCTLSGTISTASTNATNVKASAGTVCGGHAVNTTATVAYIRWYNLASAPTCSSATGFVATTPVPANSSGNGLLLDFGPFGAAFATGIGFCITGGGSSTDNTSAVAGVYVNATYK